MSNNYAIIAQEKRRGPNEFNGIMAENKRSIAGKNVNKKLSHTNIILTPCPYKNYDDFVEKKRAQIKAENQKQEQNKKRKKGRMPRVTINQKTGEKKYPSLMQEFVFTYTPNALSTEESILYLELADKFIREWYPDNEVISSIIHKDEETFHLHIWATYFSNLQCRFVQSDLQDAGKTNINIIREAWQKTLKEEGFDLIKQDGSVMEERGRKHDGSKALKALGDANKEILAYKKKIEILEMRAENAEQTVAKLQTEEATTALETKKKIADAKAEGKAEAIAEIKKNKIENPTSESLLKALRTSNEEVRILKKAKEDIEKEIVTQTKNSNEKDTQIENLTTSIKNLKSHNNQLLKKIDSAAKWETFIKDRFGLDLHGDQPPLILESILQEDNYNQLGQANPHM